MRSRTLPKKHLKNSTSKITKKCSNGLQNDSKIDPKWSPWEVRKGSGRQVATKSANINYNHYLLHFSDVLPFAKPLILMNFETKKALKIDAWRATQKMTSKKPQKVRKVLKMGSHLGPQILRKSMQKSRRNHIRNQRNHIFIS